MWEFLGEVAERYGPVFLICLLALGAAGYAIRALWKRNKELQDMVQPTEEMLEEATARWEDKLEQLRSHYESRLGALQERRLEEARNYGARIDELQEKRVNESQAMVREAMTILRDTQSSVDRITAVMEDIRALVRG